jgi:translation initiation factor 1
MSPSDKIPTEGGQSLGHNPFAALNPAGLPTAPIAPLSTPQSLPVNPANARSSQDKSRAGSSQQRDKIESSKNRGRVDILRETAGRGGKTVTVVTNFIGIGLPEKEQLAKKMQKACGAGGTVKDGRIEIQGDRREIVARILTEAGFRPVFAGG